MAQQNVEGLLMRIEGLVKEMASLQFTSLGLETSEECH